MVIGELELVCKFFDWVAEVYNVFFLMVLGCVWSWSRIEGIMRELVKILFDFIALRLELGSCGCL